MAIRRTSKRPELKGGIDVVLISSTTVGAKVAFDHFASATACRKLWNSHFSDVVLRV